MVRINLNEHIKVKFTKEALDLIDEEGINLYSSERPCGCLQESRIQLWRFMHIYSYVHKSSLGKFPIIVENTLVIGDDNEHV